MDFQPQPLKAFYHLMHHKNNLPLSRRNQHDGKITDDNREEFMKAVLSESIAIRTMLGKTAAECTAAYLDNELVSLVLTGDIEVAHKHPFVSASHEPASLNTESREAIRRIARSIPEEPFLDDCIDEKKSSASHAVVQAIGAAAIRVIPQELKSTPSGARKIEPTPIPEPQPTLEKSAACIDSYEIFDAEEEAYDEAVAICKTCYVKKDCFERYMEIGKHGNRVWAGMKPHQLTRKKNKIKAQPPQRKVS